MGSHLSAKMQSVYSTTPAEWAELVFYLRITKINIFFLNNSMSLNLRGSILEILRDKKKIDIA